VLRVRVTSDDLDALYRLALRRGQSLAAMIREHILGLAGQAPGPLPEGCTVVDDTVGWIGD